jgi:hypothetical protein
VNTHVRITDPKAIYLLVFRETLIRHPKAMSPAEIGSLLLQWLEWHDQLEMQGKLRFRCPVDLTSRSVSNPSGTATNSSWRERQEPMIGYLLVEAINLEEATEIAHGCPGLEHGFMVEIYSPFERCNECSRGSKI